MAVSSSQQPSVAVSQWTASNDIFLTQLSQAPQGADFMSPAGQISSKSHLLSSTVTYLPSNEPELCPLNEIWISAREWPLPWVLYLSIRGSSYSLYLLFLLSSLCFLLAKSSLLQVPVILHYSIY